MLCSIRYPLILTLGCLFIAGCQSTKTSENVYITDTAAVNLLSGNYLESDIEEIQQIYGRYGSQDFNIYVYVLADTGSISLVGITPTGQQLFDIGFTSGNLTATAAMGFKNDIARYILMDFQLTFFDAGALKSKLRRTGLVFSEETTGNSSRRTLSDGETLIIEIVKNDSVIQFSNHLRGYVYRIQRNHSELEI